MPRRDLQATCRFSEDELLRLDTVAEFKGLERSSYMRLAMLDHVATVESDPRFKAFLTRKHARQTPPRTR